MKKLFATILLVFNLIALCAQTVTLNGDTAIFNEEGIVLNASFAPTTSGTWYWATTDAGLDLSTQHGSTLSVTPSDTGVFLFRAVFFDGARSFFQDFKVTVAPCGAKLLLQDYESQTYRSKRYGSVCWMAQNLRSTQYSPDGAPIPFAHTYNDNEEFAEVFGRLYDYNSALNGGTGNSVQGVCPTGWQIPMESHLNAVINQNPYAYDYQTGGWLSNGATNSERFYLYPAGFYNASTMRYENMYGEAYLILNTPVIASNQIRVGGCAYNCPSWLVDDASVNNAYSVRCIKTHPLIDTFRDAPRRLHTIQYLGNGAETGVMPPQTGIGDSTITLASNAFGHGGNWQFEGWNTKMDGSGTAFTNGQSLMLTQDTILYAQWHTWCTGDTRSNERGTSRIDTLLDANGNTYAVVQIGSQCWMKQNLKAANYSDGTPIAKGTTFNDSVAYRYYPNDDTNNVAKYGYLYNWPAVMHGADSSSNIPSGVQGICPVGWHVPSDAEWTQMTNYVGSQSSCQCGGNSNNIAKALASTARWSGDNGTCAIGNELTSNNVTGFSVLPSGGYFYGNCQAFGLGAYYWTTTRFYSGAWVRLLRSDNAMVNRFNSTANNGFSVRCVRDVISLIPKLGLCETCSEGTITVKVVENVASIVWRNSDNDSVSNSLTGLVQSATIPAGVYTATATSIDGSTVTCTATLGKATAHPCTVNSLNAGTTLAGGKYANKEFGSGTRLDSVSDHQGNVYRVAQIGEGANAQCWLAENMRCTTSPNTNSTIVLGPYSSWICAHHSKCAIYHDTLRYGILYNWCAAVDTFDAANNKPEVASTTESSGWIITLPAGNRRGICPKGWHIPTDAEWTTLASIAGVGQGGDTGVSKLSGGCDWKTKEGGSYPGSYDDPQRNSTGFSALPAGRCRFNAALSSVGKMALFWSATSTSDTTSEAYDRIFNNENRFGTGGEQYLVSDKGTRYDALSVRCLRDEQNMAINDTITFIPNGGTGAMEKQVLPRGVETALSNSTFTHTGNWEFIGWNTDALGNGTSYADGDNVTTDGNDTLYAQWHTWCNGTPATGVEGGTSRVDSVKDYDGNWYHVVQIGNQCWLKENLKTTHYANGNYISKGDVSSTTAAYRYFPNNDSSNVAVYGCLYNWAAVMNGQNSSAAIPSGVQGVCPMGWHVPSNAEWIRMTDTVSAHPEYVCGGDNTYINKALSSTAGWRSGSGNCNVAYQADLNNATGFSAPPAGVYNGYSSTYGDLHSNALFWSSTKKDNEMSYYISWGYLQASVWKGWWERMSSGLSVRCVRDEDAGGTSPDCLAAGTRIMMADGSYKNVEDIVAGDRVRSFDHETGGISSAEICLAWKSTVKKQALNLTFASGKTIGIVGKHDFLFENTRKYVRISKDNVAEYVGMRFYNAESGSWDALVSYEVGAPVDYYCPYTVKHLNCIAEGMLSCPDDVDYILNIYELDSNLKADAAQLAADIAQYGLCDVAQDFPALALYKDQMENLGALYFYIAIGKGLVSHSIIDEIRVYWTGR